MQEKSFVNLICRLQEKAPNRMAGKIGDWRDVITGTKKNSK